MKISQQVGKTLISLGFLITIVSSSAIATEMPTHQTNQFRKIEQPFTLKLAVTLAGLGLIGTEFWWFLLHNSNPKSSTTTKTARTHNHR